MFLFNSYKEVLENNTSKTIKAYSLEYISLQNKTSPSPLRVRGFQDGVAFCCLLNKPTFQLFHRFKMDRWKYFNFFFAVLVSADGSGYQTTAEKASEELKRNTIRFACCKAKWSNFENCKYPSNFHVQRTKLIDKYLIRRVVGDCDLVISLAWSLQLCDLDQLKNGTFCYFLQMPNLG